MDEYVTKPLTDGISVYWPDNAEDEKWFREVEKCRDLNEDEEVDPDRFWVLRSGGLEY